MGNWIDSLIGYFNPVEGLKRERARVSKELLTRTYDISKPGRKNGNWFRPSTSSREEVSRAFKIGAYSAQELCRNNPLAIRAKNLWVNNIVGSGIIGEITHRSSTNKAKKANEVFEQWAESTVCDFYGVQNLYGLQNLWVSSIVEGGGVFIRKHINPKMKFPLQLQTIEQQYLDSSKSKKTESGGVITDGIQYSAHGEIEGYWIFDDSDSLDLRQQSRFHRVDEIIHIYRKERATQHVGMTWFHGVAERLRDYDVYSEAKLIQQQVAACFALIVEEAEQALGVSSISKGTHELPDEITPGMVEYIKAGQKVSTVTPPKADNASKFEESIKRDIAAGLGLTYEMLTGDYSVVNFASGRMGKSEFYSTLDSYQKTMMQPSLDRVFDWFSTIYRIKYGDDGLSVDWTFPARPLVNPQEEFDVLMSKVRHGMLSPSKAAKILGEKLPNIIEQWRKDKDLFGDMPFDIDPSVYAATGNQLNTDDAASANKDTPTKTDKADKK